MPKSHKNFWIVLIFVLAGIAIAVFVITSRPKPELVTVAFVGFTNDSGHKLYLFRGTNWSDQPISYYVQLEYGGDYTLDSFTSLNRRAAPARQGFTFSLEVPTSGKPLRLGLLYAPSMTKWEHYRAECAEFLRSQRMPAIARMIGPDMDGFHTIVGPEIHE